MCIITIYKCAIISKKNKHLSKIVIIINVWLHRKSFSNLRCVWGVNAIFNNASVISWQSVFLVEEIGVPGENHLKLEYHSFLFILHYIKKQHLTKSTRLKIDKLDLYTVRFRWVHTYRTKLNSTSFRTMVSPGCRDHILYNLTSLGLLFSIKNIANEKRRSNSVRSMCIWNSLHNARSSMISSTIYLCN